jgi:hypothetical protein
MKKFIFPIIIVGTMLLSACFPVALTPNADATGTKIAGDIFATQTGLAYPTYLQQMVNATTTAMAESFYATQTKMAYQVPSVSVPMATIPSQSTSQAVVNSESLSVRSGPGTVYDVVAYVVRGDSLSILGQAYNCSWLNIKTTAGKTGWVASTYLVYSIACGEIAQAIIPPVPTKGAEATQVASGCSASSSITVTNSTTGDLSVDLNGPASYHVYLASPGASNTISVCPGTYNWSATSSMCTGAGTGTVDSGGTLDLSCS